MLQVAKLDFIYQIVWKDNCSVNGLRQRKRREDLPKKRPPRKRLSRPRSRPPVTQRQPSDVPARFASI